MNLRIDHLFLKEGEGICVGVDPELSVGIHIEGDSLTISTPVNVNAKTFKVTRGGVEEIK